MCIKTKNKNKNTGYERYDVCLVSYATQKFVILKFIFSAIFKNLPEKNRALYRLWASGVYCG